MKTVNFSIMGLIVCLMSILMKKNTNLKSPVRTGGSSSITSYSTFFMDNNTNFFIHRYLKNTNAYNISKITMEAPSTTIVGHSSSSVSLSSSMYTKQTPTVEKCSICKSNYCDGVNWETYCRNKSKVEKWSQNEKKRKKCVDQICIIQQLQIMQQQLQTQV